MNQAAAAAADVDEECIKVIPLPPGYYQPHFGLPNLPPTYSPPLNPHHPCGTNNHNNNTLPSVAGRPPSQVHLNQILLHNRVTAPPAPNRRRRRRVAVALVILFLFISFLIWLWEWLSEKISWD